MILGPIAQLVQGADLATTHLARDRDDAVGSGGGAVMDRRTRTLIVVAVAVVTAVVASATVYRAIRRMPVREVEVAHHFIVLAARPLPLGTRLSAADVKLVGWPSDSPLPGAFARVEDVVGRGLITGGRRERTAHRERSWRRARPARACRRRFLTACAPSRSRSTK